MRQHNDLWILNSEINIVKAKIKYHRHFKCFWDRNIFSTIIAFITEEKKLPDYLYPLGK